MSSTLNNTSPAPNRFSISALWLNPTPSKSTSSRRKSDPSKFSNENVVWKSFEVNERETFERLRRGTGKANFCAKGSPFLPSTFKEYLNHRVEYLEDQITALKRAIALKEEQSNVEVMPAFGGKNVGVPAWLGFRPIERALGHPWDGDEEFRARGEQLLGKDLLREI